MVPVRRSRPADGVVLQDIERRAGERFREVGFPNVAEADPFSLEELDGYVAAGRSWVAVDDDDVPVGYVVVDIVDGNAHVEQVSVDPDHQGRDAGRALMDTVRSWAEEEGRPAITLTTFRDVEWNRPLYEHLGYAVLHEDAIGPELRGVRAAEAAEGLDPEQRVCMRLLVRS